MKQVLLLSLIVTISVNVFAQQTPRIEFNVKTTEKLALLAYHYGDKQYVKDSLFSKGDGKFVYESEETLDGGMYMFVIPDKTSFDFFVSEDEQRFSVTATPGPNLAKSAKFKNSPDNTLFYKYLNFLGDKRTESKKYVDELQKLTKEKGDAKRIAELREILNGFTKEVTKFQADLMKNNPNTLTAAFIALSQDVTVPENPNPSDSTYQYRYYKNHYFDNINLKDDRLIRTPMMHRKVMRYMEKVVIQSPDSLIKELDWILKESSEDNFDYFLVKFLNKYAKAQIVGMDAVYVHIALNYLEKGKTGLISEDDVKKIVENAKKLNPLLIGKIAPDFYAQLVVNPEQYVNLHGVDAAYTVLIFWAPDCGHCKKSMPKAVEFYEKYRLKGVKIFSVCNKFGEKSSTCPPFIKEKGLGDLINVFDTTPRHRSYFNVLYDIKSTPVIYVLDKDKRIISKRIGVEQLGEVIDNYIKREEYLKKQKIGTPVKKD